MLKSVLLITVLFVTSLVTDAVVEASEVADLRHEVAETERAFADTMARRDLDSFAAFLADETIFFSGPNPLRGKEAVVAEWSSYFEGPEAPFSWEPETVEVLDSGVLALSSGPVRNEAGVVVGTFTSIWRQESPGNWKIVFDKGNAACDPEGR